jgi:predicted transcriptional regulator
MTILKVTVGESIEAAFEQARSVAKALQRGERVGARQRVGFDDMGQMLAVFTPQRWTLIAALRAAGPVTIAELARRLDRDYKNVHTDVGLLSEWWVVERGEDGRISVPWSEIVVDLKLPDQAAA